MSMGCESATVHQDPFSLSVSLPVRHVPPYPKQASPSLTVLCPSFHPFLLRVAALAPTHLSFIQAL